MKKKLFPHVVIACLLACLAPSGSAQLAPAGSIFVHTGTRYFIFGSQSTDAFGASFDFFDFSTGTFDSISPTISTGGAFSGVSPTTGRAINGQVSSTTISLTYNGQTVSAPKASVYGSTRKFAGKWIGFATDPTVGLETVIADISSQGQAVVLVFSGFNVSYGVGTISAAGDFNIASLNGAVSTGRFAPTMGIAIGSFTPQNGQAQSYVLTRSVRSRMANISTRGLVGSGEQVLIGGFIITDGGKTVFLDAKGPSLSAAGVANPVHATQINLFSGSTLIASNNGWRNNTNIAEIQASGLAPTDDRESALQVALEPGAYTFVVSSGDSSTGVGLVEAFGVGDSEGP